MSIGPLREAPRATTPATATTTPSTTTTATTTKPNTSDRSHFDRLVHGLGHEVARGEATMRAALRAPADLGPSELLALQAGVYRYSEAVDLAAKLVDRATSGVKTVIQGQ